MTLETSFEQFNLVMASDRRTAAIDPDSMALIFERLVEKIKRRKEEELQKAQRLHRRAIDDLRYVIKHLEPPVAKGATWDQVRPRIDSTDEYRALDSDELRRAAFEKYVQRQKEKDDERQEYSRRGDKDRDRRHRNGHSTRPRTRTPEVDAYEADRRKATAERERNAGKKGVAGFSPPPHVDRYDGRAHRSQRPRSLSRYDRDRRDRDSERERERDPPRERERERERERPHISRAGSRDLPSPLDYGSRAGPRDITSALDYGDSRPSLRRKREVDVDGKGDPKVCPL
jgi:pre-mRNA-processing factor 40